MANPYPGNFPPPQYAPTGNQNGTPSHTQQYNLTPGQMQVNGPPMQYNTHTLPLQANTNGPPMQAPASTPPISSQFSSLQNPSDLKRMNSPSAFRPPPSPQPPTQNIYNGSHSQSSGFGTPPPTGPPQAYNASPQSRIPPTPYTTSQPMVNTSYPNAAPPTQGTIAAPPSISTLNAPPSSMSSAGMKPPVVNTSYSNVAPPFQNTMPGPPLVPQQNVPPSINSTVSNFGPPPLPGQSYIQPNQQAYPPPSTAALGPNQIPGNVQVNHQHPPIQPQPHLPPPMGPPTGQQSIQAQPMSLNQGYPPTSNQPYQSNTQGIPGPGSFPSQPGYNATNQAPAYGQQFPSMSGITQGMGQMNINDANRPVDLLKEKRLIPEVKVKEKPLRFETGGRGEFIPPKRENSSINVFRSTLKAIPATQSLLSKVKLPFGLVIHPFRDLSSLPVISAGTIVRCKKCRTYINPFVTFLNQRQWRCNLCFFANEVPEEFLHHPVTKSYGQPHTRPECTNSTLEFIAPQEYMVRPPQPAVYLFLLDVSHAAVSTGYLQIFCEALLEHLDHLPGDSRTKIGFLTYTGTIQFYRLGEGCSQPQLLVVSDIDDVFLPTPDSLLVNLKERRELVTDLLQQLPQLLGANTSGDDTQSALGAALQIAHKLVSPFGGRVTVFQHTLPIIGPGSLKVREDTSSKKSAECLNPSTDFYKKIALECSGHQVAVDFFFLNSRYVDIATLSSASRFSAGDIHYYPGLHTVHNAAEADRLARDLDRYFTRKIGFEAVMRIRCTKGIGVHTFHGNFYVRSTDLLALANVNPDAGYAINLTLDDSLEDLREVSFQAALLYTSSKGERRIRVHTMCFPVVKTEMEVYNNVDSVAVVSLLSKMAVDRSITSSINDARDALLNAVIDPLKVYNTLVQGSSLASSNSLLASPALSTFPLYISALLKHPAFQMGVSQRLDDRVFHMISLKMQPAMYAMQSIYPDLYRVDDLTDEGGIQYEDHTVPQPNVLPLSAEYTSQDGAFLLDAGWQILVLIGRRCNQAFIRDVIGAPQFSNIGQGMFGLPDLDNPRSDLFNNFIDWLQDQRPHHATVQVIRDDSQEKYHFFHYLRQDRTESTMSLPEFLMHVQQKIKS